MKQKIVYPNISCREHPGLIEPGYVICYHINSKSDVAYFEPATSANMGIVACAKCLENEGNSEYMVANFTVACAEAIRESGYDIPGVVN